MNFLKYRQGLTEACLKINTKKLPYNHSCGARKNNSAAALSGNGVPVILKQG